MMDSSVLASAMGHLHSATLAEELPLASIVRFACHGISDSVDLDSTYLLLNGKDKAGKLTVRQISSCRAPAAELAYLSTRSSAENRSINLSTRETCQTDCASRILGSKTRSIIENL
jgi:CHAT domain-containing protein